MIVLKPTTHQGHGHLDRASVYGTEGYWFEPSGVYWLLQNNRRRVGKKGKQGLDPDANGDTLGAMDMPIKLPTHRRLCSTTEAAGIYGCSVGHIRGMANREEIWSQRITERSWLYDSDEIAKLAKERERLRGDGKLPGRRPGHLKSA